MTWNLLRRALLAGIVLASATAFPVAAQRLDPIAANDNRTAAGELRNGV